MVIVPLLVQLDEAGVPVTMMLFPAHGLLPGEAELSFLQEIKLAAKNIIISARNTTVSFFDITLILNNIELNNVKVAWFNLFYPGISKPEDHFNLKGEYLIPKFNPVEYNFTPPSPTPFKGIEMEGSRYIIN